MKNKFLQIRISEDRLNKFRLYSIIKGKTMTQLIENWIDLLEIPEINNSSNTSLPNQPNG